MTIAKLEFDLPEDQDDFTLATKGADLYFVLGDIDQFLRSILKYEADEYNEKNALDVVRSIREELHEMMDNRNLSLDMVS